MEITDHGQTIPGTESAQSEAPAPSITNLDSLSEFEFQGERFTPERLQEIYKGYQTFGEQQKSAQSEDRFWRNLEADIDNVVQNPALAEQFKRVYPQKFHAILNKLMPNSEPQSPSIPKELTERLSKVDQMEARLHQMAVESANAKLDAILPKLYDKYPMAVEDQVLARAEAFLSQGGKLTDGIWERLAKESHESARKRSDAYYKKELQAQTTKGIQAQDIGPGGAAPGKAPPKIRSFDEAQTAMIAHMKSQGYT